MATTAPTQSIRAEDGNDRRTRSTRRKEDRANLRDAYLELEEFLKGEDILGNFRIH